MKRIILTVLMGCLITFTSFSQVITYFYVTLKNGYVAPVYTSDLEFIKGFNNERYLRVGNGCFNIDNIQSIIPEVPDDGEDQFQDALEEYTYYLEDENRGPVSDGFAAGDGTSAKPYLITSAAELRYLSDAVTAGKTFSGKYFKLTEDIKINDNVLDINGDPNPDEDFEMWLPIGINSKETPCFLGNFDGDNHVISGLYCNFVHCNAGLFGYVGYKGNSNIQNIIIKDSYFATYSGSAGPIAYLRGTTADNNKISKVINYATIFSHSSYAGGILGYDCYNTKVTSCANFGKISGKKGGGICGNSSQNILNCANFGIIFGVYNASGIEDMTLKESVIRNCLNRGEIIGEQHASGMICYSNQKFTLSNCVNIGAVTSVKYAPSSLVNRLYHSCTISYNMYLTSACDSKYSDIESGITVTNSSTNKALTEEEMKSQTVLNSLNSHKYSSDATWVTGPDGYPTLDFIINLQQDTSNNQNETNEKF